MKITNFTFCDRVEEEQIADGRTLTKVIDPLSKINPLAVPGNFSFCIAVSMTHIENGDTLRLEFVDPSGIVGIKTEDLGLPVTPDEDTAINFHMDIRNYPFTKEGLYIMRAYNKDEVVEEKSIEVVGQQQFSPVIIKSGRKH